MAAIAPTITDISKHKNGSVLLATWANVVLNDTCVGTAELVDLPDKTVHAWGTFDSGSVGLHGSNNGGLSYVFLRDPSSTNIAITAEGVRSVLENPHYVKPLIASAGANSNLNIAVVARLAQPIRI